MAVADVAVDVPDLTADDVRAVVGEEEDGAGRRELPLERGAREGPQTGQPVPPDERCVELEPLVDVREGIPHRLDSDALQRPPHTGAVMPAEPRPVGLLELDDLMLF